MDVTSNLPMDTCLKLIDLVKAKPFLYDPRDNNYCNKNVKLSAWEDIGTVLGCPGSMAKDIWGKFRQKYAGINFRLRNPLYSGKDPSWALYDDLSFLADCIVERKPRSSLLTHNPDAPRHNSRNMSPCSTNASPDFRTTSFPKGEMSMPTPADMKGLIMPFSMEDASPQGQLSQNMLDIKRDRGLHIEQQRLQALQHLGQQDLFQHQNELIIQSQKQQLAVQAAKQKLQQQQQQQHQQQLLQLQQQEEPSNLSTASLTPAVKQEATTPTQQQQQQHAEQSGLNGLNVVDQQQPQQVPTDNPAQSDTSPSVRPNLLLPGLALQNLLSAATMNGESPFGSGGALTSDQQKQAAEYVNALLSTSLRQQQQQKQEQQQQQHQQQQQQQQQQQERKKHQQLLLQQRLQSQHLLQLQQQHHQKLRNQEQEQNQHHQQQQQQQHHQRQQQQHQHKLLQQQLLKKLNSIHTEQNPAKRNSVLQSHLANGTDNVFSANAMKLGLNNNMSDLKEQLAGNGNQNGTTNGDPSVAGLLRINSTAMNGHGVETAKLNGVLSTSSAKTITKNGHSNAHQFLNPSRSLSSSNLRRHLSTGSTAPPTGNIHGPERVSLDELPRATSSPNDPASLTLASIERLLARWFGLLFQKFDHHDKTLSALVELLQVTTLASVGAVDMQQMMAQTTANQSTVSDFVSRCQTKANVERELSGVSDSINGAIEGEDISMGGGLNGNVCQVEQVGDTTPNGLTGGCTEDVDNDDGDDDNDDNDGVNDDAGDNRKLQNDGIQVNGIKPHEAGSEEAVAHFNAQQSESSNVDHGVGEIVDSGDKGSSDIASGDIVSNGHTEVCATTSLGSNRRSPLGKRGRPSSDEVDEVDIISSDSALVRNRTAINNVTAAGAASPDCELAGRTLERAGGGTSPHEYANELGDVCGVTSSVGETFPNPLGDLGHGVGLNLINGEGKMNGSCGSGQSGSPNGVDNGSSGYYTDSEAPELKADDADDDNHATTCGDGEPAHMNMISLGHTSLPGKPDSQDVLANDDDNDDVDGRQQDMLINRPPAKKRKAIEPDDLDRLTHQFLTNDNYCLICHTTLSNRTFAAAHIADHFKDGIPDEFRSRMELENRT